MMPPRCCRHILRESPHRIRIITYFNLGAEESLPQVEGAVAPTLTELPRMEIVRNRIAPVLTGMVMTTGI